ncbi:ATP cone domain-containing protein [Spirochaeta africana]|uniref:ribonucleoside-triphosphate reductase (thioredoxin) n=1 Tax=Spirochaeta africana (strain ATCC 700263 / DSM 8902 / Z-7692) TaxID=889378 RepID=H9ULQ5_SPIAZ|nr:ATP cone domain-containing protein [Spirochaeta africana]AFG38448.1 oxygen-sensitive ribonucleoside-triphosphate reductase [Spirochaeta africana DSM 8902]
MAETTTHDKSNGARIAVRQLQLDAEPGDVKKAVDTAGDTGSANSGASAASAAAAASAAGTANAAGKANAAGAAGAPNTAADGGTRPIPEAVLKRDGHKQPFEAGRIANALERCFQSAKPADHVSIEELTNQVVNVVAAKYDVPTVEQIQDIVEMVLQAAGEYEAAKAYILYRAEHEKMRKDRPVPDEVKNAFAESDKYFPTQIQKFQFYDKYSRFNYDLGRRETWVETVDRAVGYLREISKNRLEDAVYERLRRGILEMKVMPSMRLLAMAGAPAERSNIAIYNCSYLPVDSIDSFVEALIISMNGCGVGYSVERKYIECMPRIQRQNGTHRGTYVVQDTSEGWAEALRTALKTWFAGEDIDFDYSEVRPAGAPLKIKGGRASGPEPLRQMINFAKQRVIARQGGFLTSLDAHDIMCAVGGAAVSGGVRRTAMISLFDYDDAEMRHCKDGDFWHTNGQRWNANNSAVWPNRELSQQEIATFVLDMVQSGRGEPGIFNRRAAVDNRPARRAEAEFGTNPCGEIILRPFQFCNLTSAIARADDTFESLKNKVEMATILGSIQSMATNFPGLRPQWQQNCEEERLLGVDLNGQMDSPACQDPDVQSRLRYVAVETNRIYAEKLGINQSASVTAVKPSGNSSQLMNSASGLHARWAPYYIRNVRVGAHTPIFRVLQDEGVPMDPENGQTVANATTWVAHFPVKSPDAAITRNSRTALEQCEYWLQNKVHYTEHNPSVTITYRSDEVIDIIKWIWENQDKIGGMAFLPAVDAQYDQMPYVEITREEYERLAKGFPDIDFSKVYRYEERDLTTAAQELACMSGQCDI